MGEGKKKKPNSGSKKDRGDSKAPQKKNFGKKRDAKGDSKKNSKGQKMGKMFGVKKPDKTLGGFVEVKEEVYKKAEKKTFKTYSHGPDDERVELNRR